MYHLLLLHSILRWIVLAAILWVIFRAWKGFFSNDSFRRSDHILVSSASGFSQMQLMVGFLLYFWSPIAQGFWANRSFEWSDSLFFGVIHFALMTVAITVLSIGSSLAKRATDDDRKRFKTLLIYYFLALAIILIAIPWPFSPLAQRPYFREF